MKRFLLPAVVFITGASVLIVEIIAVRVLSPYYGNTIFTVSSVITVILLALSVGYYLGGVLADRRPSLEWFFSIILASGLLLMSFHLLGLVLLPRMSSAFSLAVGPLVSAGLLFLFPALLLGTLSPYAVKLQSVYVPDAGVGRVAGSIFFWSTLGSITGSLLAGFFLIPRFGIDGILISTSLALIALGLIPLWFVEGRAKGRASASTIVIGAALGTAWWLFGTATVDAIYIKDGVYQKITIYEGEYVGRPARFLLLDRSESGAMFLDSEDPVDLVYDYTKYHRLYKVFTPNVRKALVLGGGAYSIPKALLEELPDAAIDVAEIEPSFFALAKQYFRAPDSPRLRNHVQDGRRFLQDAGTYDLIFGDVYYSYFSVPPQFTTREFFDLAKRRLSPGGVFIANMIGDLSRQQPSLIMAELRTFQMVFPNSYFFAVDAVDKTNLVQNITLVGYNSDRHVDVTAPPVTTDPDPIVRYLQYHVLDVPHRYELSSYPVLTDNFSPVEYLTARVLQRSLNASDEVRGTEIRAVVDQQLRYGDRSAGTTGHARLVDFLRAELAVLTQEVTEQQGNLVGRIFVDEPRRVALVADMQRSPAAVAVLIEVMRGLLSSPVPPAVGVDFVFADGVAGTEAFARDPGSFSAGSRPDRLVDLEREYRVDLDRGTPDDLQRVAASLMSGPLGISRQ